MLIIGIAVLYLIYSHFINKYLDIIGKHHYDDEIRIHDLCHSYLPNYYAITF